MDLGLISDTHGLMRPQALDALCGCDLILHAGDIGSPEVLRALETIAPLRAIRGNNDSGAWALALPETVNVDAGGLRIHLLHDAKELALDPVAEDIGIVVSGHSHKPLIDRRGEVLFINPGSAGPRRFRLPVTLARLRIEGAQPHAEILQLA